LRFSCHSSCCSSSWLPTNRTIAASLGKMPTTLVRRFITGQSSAPRGATFSRSSGLVLQILRQCSWGKCTRLPGVNYIGGRLPNCRRAAGTATTWNRLPMSILAERGLTTLRRARWREGENFLVYICCNGAEEGGQADSALTNEQFPNRDQHLDLSRSVVARAGSAVGIQTTFPFGNKPPNMSSVMA
jgi:hypothetical protein